MGSIGYYKKKSILTWTSSGGVPFLTNKNSLCKRAVFNVVVGYMEQEIGMRS
jgi:hypothetical protein